MDGFPVRQQNDPQIPPAHLRDRCPTANPAVLLNDFFYRVFNDVLDPLQSDHGSIRALAHSVEVLGEFHKRQSTRYCGFVKSRWPDLIKVTPFWPKTYNNSARLNVAPFTGRNGLES